MATRSRRYTGKTGRNEATGAQTVEVVHETLIREWGSLRHLF
ncbi:MAG: hypothetical protein VKL59_13565 [Nostocaceae cyanobacterium]|nr:hypothetical protein [Nostocaceae cyanobacterium]